MDFNQGCVSYRSMPFWCVGSPLSDPFGGAVLSRFDSLEIAKIIAWAGREGYIEATSYHDDDLVPWDPEHPEDDLDPSSPAGRKLREIKAVLDDAGVNGPRSICSLHRNRLFRDGPGSATRARPSAASPRRRSSARSASGSSSARNTMSTGSRATVSRFLSSRSGSRSTSGWPKG